MCIDSFCSHAFSFSTSKCLSFRRIRKSFGRTIKIINEIENRPNEKEIAGMKEKFVRTRREFLLNGVLKNKEYFPTK